MSQPEEAAPGGNAGIRSILAVPEIRAVVVGTFVIMLGFAILFPVLPRYAKSFGVGYAAIGLLGASFGFTRLVFDLFAGRLVGRFGERRLATGGALIVAVSSAFSALAPTFTLLVAARAIGGIGSSFFLAALLSYLLKAVPKEQIGRVTGVYYGAFNLGFIAGPPIGGFLAARFGLVSPLWVYSALSAAAAVLYWGSLRELPREPGRRAGVRAIRWDRPFLAVQAVNLSQALLISSVYSILLPLYVQDRLGLGVGAVAIALSVSSLTETIALFPAGKAADRIGRKHVLIPSLLLVVGALPLFALIHSQAALFVAVGVLGVCTGIGGVAPTAMLSDLTDEATSGPAAGVFRFVFDLGLFAGPLFAGVSAGRVGLGPSFAVAAVPSVLALALLLSVRDTLPSQVVNP